MLPRNNPAFEEAFSYAKDLFEHHLGETLQTKHGSSLMANFLCTAKLMPALMQPQLAEKYDINLGIFDKHPWEVKDREYPCTNARNMHTQFDGLRLNVLQRARPHNPNKLRQIQDQLVCMVAAHKADLQKHANDNVRQKFTL